MIHTLIVGPRGVGKSTLINRVLEELKRPVYGYQTKKENALSDEQMKNPIYIYEPGKPRSHSKENLLGYCSPTHSFQVRTGIFDRYASQILKPVAADGIIVFDEIGFMEANEKLFCDAIFTRLDGEIPVIAAVKDKKEFPFLEKVRTHPKCRCFYINEENRNSLFSEVLEFMRTQIASSLYERYKPPFNQKSLNYFSQLQEAHPQDTPEFAVKKWNQRAEFWKKERTNQRKGDHRVHNAIALLEQRGILDDHCDIVDIGCGPGRFVSEFAKKAHRVVGLDISETMIAHGREHIEQQGLTNAVLRTCNFEALDFEKAGYKGAFDLVFSSITPAIHDLSSLLKSMEMSRAWCCNITHLSGYNHLRAQIMEEVFGRKMQNQWNGRWFYSLFNMLFLLGYNPETSYDTHHQEILITPDEEYVAFIMEHMLPESQYTRENTEKVFSWLKAHTDENGQLLEITDSSYGTIIWDIRKKTERPDFRTGECQIR